MAYTIPQSYYDAIKKQESGGDPYIKAKTSSASGLYQFIKATWVSLGGQWGTDSTKAFGGLRPSEAEQESMIRKLTEQSADWLERKGIAVNGGSLYAVHFLGNKEAEKVYSAKDSDKVVDILSPATLSANPFLRKMTVAQFKTWADKAGGAANTAIDTIIQAVADPWVNTGASASLQSAYANVIGAAQTMGTGVQTAVTNIGEKVDDATSGPKELFEKVGAFFSKDTAVRFIVVGVGLAFLAAAMAFFVRNSPTVQAVVQTAAKVA